jgi:hypothetical protein
VRAYAWLVKLGASVVSEPYNTTNYVIDLGASAPALQEARARWEALGDPRLLGLTLFFLGVSALEQGNDE